MKTAKKIINILLVSITILITIINVYILYMRLIKKQNIIKINGYAAFIVISGSMEPTINVNDLIIIKEQKQYNEQDIITYQSNQSVITHRIIKKEGDNIWTKGDNNNTQDKPIKTSDIYGKYIYKIENVGKVVEIINSPIGITLFFVIIYLYIKAITTKEGRWQIEKR